MISRDHFIGHHIPRFTAHYKSPDARTFRDSGLTNVCSHEFPTSASFILLVCLSSTYQQYGTKQSTIYSSINPSSRVRGAVQYSRLLRNSPVACTDHRTYRTVNLHQLKTNCHRRSGRPIIIRWIGQWYQPPVVRIPQKVSHLKKAERGFGVRGTGNSDKIYLCCKCMNNLSAVYLSSMILAAIHYPLTQSNGQ